MHNAHVQTQSETDPQGKHWKQYIIQTNEHNKFFNRLKDIGMTSDSLKSYAYTIKKGTQVRQDPHTLATVYLSRRNANKPNVPEHAESENEIYLKRNKKT